MSELIKLIEDDGWYLDRQRSSHLQSRLPTKPGLVTVAGHPPVELAPKTLESILRRAGLSRREETIELMREAIAFHLGGLAESGEPVPAPSSESAYVEVDA